MGKLYINDNVWGQIEIEEEFVPLLSLPEFQRLKEKKQLGFTDKNPMFHGGKHTRYEHSIGAYHLMCLLINKCETPLGQFVKISKREKIVLKLLALLHDIGHGPYSHVFEPIIGISHEKSTVDVISSLRPIIDGIFGVSITDEVLELFKNKEQTKRGIINKSSYSTFSILIAFIDIIAGAADVDRVDYIARDLLNVMGEKKDFSKIFDYITLDIVDDFPQIVFLEQGLSLLEDYFFTRFRNYKYIYFHPITLVKEDLFKKLCPRIYNSCEININIPESVIENKIASIVSDTSLNSYTRRLAYLIRYPLEDVLIKVFDNDSEINILESEIKGYINLDSSFYGRIDRKICVYDPKKNKVYIKKINDEVKDLMQVSAIIEDEISERIIVSYLDLNLLKSYLKLEGKTDAEISILIKNISKMYGKKKYEIEKKYTCTSLNDLNSARGFLNLAEGNEYITVLNEDVYYETTAPEKKLTARKRVVDSVVVYTIKASLADETSLTKRGENNYEEMSDESFLTILNQYLLQNDFATVDSLVPKMTINTTRNKTTCKFKGSIIEVAFDVSTYKSISGKKATDYMLEAELILGNPVSLCFLNSDILSLNIMDVCLESKLVRAVRMTQ